MVKRGAISEICRNFAQCWAFFLKIITKELISRPNCENGPIWSHWWHHAFKSKKITNHSAARLLRSIGVPHFLLKAEFDNIDEKNITSIAHRGTELPRTVS